MKINNVEKFREQLYDAFCDQYYEGGVKRPSAMWKDGNEYSDDMRRERDFRWNEEESRPMVISLPRPMHFVEAKLAMIVDEDGVEFYDTSNKEEYGYLGFVFADDYKNRMSFTIAVARRIEMLWNR